MKVSIKQKITIILKYLLMLLFLLAGGSKFLASDIWQTKFINWGYPAFFHYIVGLGEMLGGIGLLIKRMHFFSSSILIIIMFGAVFTHFIHNQADEIVRPLSYISIIFIYLYVSDLPIRLRKESSN
jgi:putative oxidoreductase